MTQGAKAILLIPAFVRQTGKYTYSLLLERSSGAELNLIDGLSYPKGVFYTATGNPTKYCILEILSNILYHIEYSSGRTRRFCGLSDLSIAYLVYSTSHQPTLDSGICRSHGGQRMITKFIPTDQKRGVEDAAVQNNEMRQQIPPHLVLRPRRGGKGL